MLMILARLVRSESFWAVVKVRSPHTGPGIRYIIVCMYVTSYPGYGPSVPSPARSALFLRALGGGFVKYIEGVGSLLLLLVEINFGERIVIKKGLCFFSVFPYKIDFPVSEEKRWRNGHFKLGVEPPARRYYSDRYPDIWDARASLGRYNRMSDSLEGKLSQIGSDLVNNALTVAVTGQLRHQSAAPQEQRTTTPTTTTASARASARAARATARARGARAGAAAVAA